MHEEFPNLVETLKKQGQGRAFFVDAETTDRWNGQPVPVLLDAANATKEDFFRYEMGGIPCVISNIPHGYDGGEYVGPWAGLENWTLDALRRDETLLDRRFKCGEDDDERTIRVRLRHFLQYTQHNRDDSPLYIFDSRFDDDKHANRILRDYRVPSYFSDDLFRLVSESRRPPYRWWLVGPERSGTCVHIDPLATSAWNTLIQGQKRWVLFPPHVAKNVVKGTGLVRDDEDDEAVHYFSFILPRIKRKATLMKGMPKYKGFACFEFTQNAGETVFVPHGWWHAVLNLSDTVAVTQNFCSRRNFDAVWQKTRTGRKKMAWKWLCALENEYPDLAARARTMNVADNFVMKYDPVEVEKRERVERERRAEAKRRKKERKEESQTKKDLHKSSHSNRTFKTLEQDTVHRASKEEEDDDEQEEHQMLKRSRHKSPTVSP